MRIRSARYASDSAPGTFVVERRDASEIFASDGVACRIDLIAVDRGRKLVRYNATVENTLSVNLTCRIYDAVDRSTRLSQFEAPAETLERVRFHGRLDGRKRAPRVVIELSGEGTALTFEIGLPQPSRAAPVQAMWLAGMFGTIGLTLAMLLFIGHIRLPHANESRHQRSGAPIDTVASATSDFSYEGAWQHAPILHNGHRDGTSSRSYHAGDRAHLTFSGERFALIGTKEPNGGFAELSLDGRALSRLDFYAPNERRMIIFSSRRLPFGKHAVEIRVLAAPVLAANRRYTNIDGARYALRPEPYATRLTMRANSRTFAPALPTRGRNGWAPR